MRQLLTCIALSALLLAAGCTSTALKDSTIATGATFTEIEYDQVLDNVAMFKYNANSLPWAITLTTGQITLTDTLTPSMSVALPIPQSASAGSFTATPGVSGSRAWALQWNVQPETSAEVLRPLAELYKFVATGQYPKGTAANPIASAPDPHVAFAAELKVDADTLPTEGERSAFTTVKPDGAFWSSKYGKITVYVSAENAGVLTKVAQVVLKLVENTHQNKAFIVGNQIRVQ